MQISCSSIAFLPLCGTNLILVLLQVLEHFLLLRRLRLHFGSGLRLPGALACHTGRPYVMMTIEEQSCYTAAPARKLSLKRLLVVHFQTRSSFREGRVAILFAKRVELPICTHCSGRSVQPQSEAPSKVDLRVRAGAGSCDTMQYNKAPCCFSNSQNKQNDTHGGHPELAQRQNHKSTPPLIKSKSA